MKYGINTKINSWGKDFPSCWEDYKITLQASFCKEKLLRATSGKNFIPNNNNLRYQKELKEK